jgi:type I restriction enzyme, R subunit
MSTPEELARENIDKQLEACGWIVQSHSEMNLYAVRGVAVREFPLEGSSTAGKGSLSTTLRTSPPLRADYLLFVDRKATRVVDASVGILERREEGQYGKIRCQCHFNGC